MPRDIDTLIDDIDRLVDDQLAAGPVDDYNVNRYDKCWHCGRDWHGMPITERIEVMRIRGTFDEDYRTAEDDSQALCPGSDFIGPIHRPPIPPRISNSRCHIVPVLVGRAAAAAPARDLAVSFRALNASAESFLTRWRQVAESLQALFGDVMNGLPDDPFDPSAWLSAATSDDAPEPSEPAPIVPAVDPAIGGRRRNREQLRARTQQQAQAATTRQQLADRMRSRMQEIGTA
jgi:hypothetical protein